MISLPGIISLAVRREEAHLATRRRPPDIEVAGRPALQKRVVQAL